MPVDVIIENSDWNGLGIGKLADSAFETLMHVLDADSQNYEVVILACDDTRIAGLNADFRGKPQATNVLSWPSEERATPGKVPPQPEPGVLGDVAIAIETCLREAASQNKDPATHVSHLLVHGMLHLLGFDHETEQDAAIMESLEVEILAKMGIADPYKEQG